jgi:hypothetical protein
MIDRPGFKFIQADIAEKEIIRTLGNRLNRLRA